MPFPPLSDRAAYHEHRRDLRRDARLSVLIWAFCCSVIIFLRLVAHSARTFGGNHGQPIFCLLHVLEMALVVQVSLLAE